MQYKYNFYVGAESTIATFEVNEPLAQIVEGNELILTTDKYSQKLGNILKIQGVRVVISHMSGNFVRYDIHVLCREQEPTLRL